MSYFSLQEEKFKVFAIYESTLIDENLFKEDFELYKINLLGEIHPFSIVNPGRTLKSIIEIRKIIKVHKINVVHILFITPHALWALFFRATYILTSRGSDILTTLPSLKSLKGLRGLYFKILYHLFVRSIKKANYITSTSQQQIDCFKEIGVLEKIALIKTGVDVGIISELNSDSLFPEELRNKSIIFSPRFIAPQYNIEYQIEGIKNLCDTITKSFYFVFVYKNNHDLQYFNRIKKELEFLKGTIGLNYIILNHVNQKIMWSIFHHSSVCIMTPFSDGTPNSALEAMAAKCPVILPKLNYEGSLFSETCLKVDLNNPQDLAEKIEEIINNKPYPMIKRAFNAVSLWGNRKIEMSKLEKIYCKLVNG